MFFALDSNDRRVFIEAAHQKEEYRCPVCGQPLLQKKGLEKRSHFAHKAGLTCVDTWTYEDSKQTDISEWHLQWQEHFPIECREIVVSNNGETHRADILIKKQRVVIEIQKSPMSPDEFDRRNRFFVSAGYSVIWIFDEVDEYDNGSLARTESEHEVYHWKRPRRTFNNWTVGDTVQVYFQLWLSDDNDDYLAPFLYKVTWVSPKGMEYLAIDSEGLSLQRFLEQFTFPLDSSSGIPLEYVCDSMTPLYVEGMMTVYSGCPISETHICTDNSLESEICNIRGCSNCQFCVDCQSVLCNKRISDLHLPDSAVVLNVSRQRNGMIESMIFKRDKSETTACKVSIPQVNPRWRTIEEQWTPNIAAAIFVNVQTGWFLKVTNKQYQAYRRTNKLKGFLSKKRYEYPDKESDVYFAERPVWKMIWFFPFQSQ